MNNQYTFKLGNVQPRKGHRRDCSEVELEVIVTAESVEHARRRLGKLHGLVMVTDDGLDVHFGLGPNVESAQPTDTIRSPFYLPEVAS